MQKYKADAIKKNIEQEISKQEKLASLKEKKVVEKVEPIADEVKNNVILQE